MARPAHEPAKAAKRLPAHPDPVLFGAIPASGSGQVFARLLGAAFNTRDLIKDTALNRLPPNSGLTIVFRYGVAVTFNEGGGCAALDAVLLTHVVEPGAEPESEKAVVSIQPGVDDQISPDGRIMLSNASNARLLLIATVLARSVVLARDEILVSEAFDRIDPLVSELRENGRVRFPIADVMKLVGDVIAARHRVMGTVQVGERPDLLWDHPDLDRLYARLETEYELREREEVLERKFGALGDFAEVLLNIVQTKRSFRLEAAIIALIAFEILLTLFDMTVR